MDQRGDKLFSIIKQGMMSNHDDLCPTSEIVAENCAICSLLRMARKDEKEKYVGVDDFNCDDLIEESYKQGFNEGMKNKNTSGNKTNPAMDKVVAQYIKDRATSLNMQEANALYKLYLFLGGE